MTTPRDDFNKLLQAYQHTGDAEPLRSFWRENGYSESSFALLQVTLNWCIMDSKWERLTVPTPEGERYMGRLNRDAGQLELQYRGSKRTYKVK